MQAGGTDVAATPGGFRPAQRRWQEGLKAWTPLLVLQGLDDYIVVDTKDVLLICQKEKEQAIKEYVAEVKRNSGDKYL